MAHIESRKVDKPRRRNTKILSKTVRHVLYTNGVRG
jgi:hypothetical protein